MRDFAMEGPMWKWDNVEWISDLEDQLQQLYEEYIMVVATSADHSGTEDMIKALERIGAHKYFDHFFSQKELGFKKPDPNFFLTFPGGSLLQHRVPYPIELVVEDPKTFLEVVKQISPIYPRSPRPRSKFQPT